MLEKYIDILVKGYHGYANYLWTEITFQYDYKPWWANYFYLLILVSAFFLVLELARPWRENQPKFRKDFWLDFFYMFFNFFLFSLIIYNALSDVFVNLFTDFLALFGLKNIVAIHLETWPFFAQLLLMFVVRDFIQWWGHRTLHRFPALWEFHKVHHSVEQMGFAAHLRYHWFENIFYRTFEYIPLAMIGFGIHDFFFVHIFALAWGHYNHANIPSNPKITGSIVAALLGAGVASMFPGLGWGATTGLIALGTVIGYGWLSKYMLYLFNSPDMHIWHHAYDIPPDRQTGINFGITLACWDYLFGTAYMPFPGKDIRLGFPGIEKFPKSFLGQNLHGFQNAQHQKPKDMEPARGTSA